jgi:site-specific recombinase XerD
MSRRRHQPEEIVAKLTKAPARSASRTRKPGSRFGPSDARLFPADRGDGHFVGVVKVLDRICARAGLKDVSPHVLRHTFSSIAGDLGFTKLTIAGLLGHSAKGDTESYVHLDTALLAAADHVSGYIAAAMDGTAPAANVVELHARTG